MACSASNRFANAPAIATLPAGCTSIFNGLVACREDCETSNRKV
jgi:hypothetical protein